MDTVDVADLAVLPLIAVAIGASLLVLPLMLGALGFLLGIIDAFLEPGRQRKEAEYEAARSVR